MRENRKKSISISSDPSAQYVKFKGFYVERLQCYYLCDFYQLSTAEGKQYQVNIHNEKKEWETCIFLLDKESANWELRQASEYPPELLAQINQIIKELEEA